MTGPGAGPHQSHPTPHRPQRRSPARPLRAAPRGPRGAGSRDGRGRSAAGGGRHRTCDRTLSPPHPVGRRASHTVSLGCPVGEYPPRKIIPKSTHARRRPEGGAPSDKHELCDRKFSCPRRGSRGATHVTPSCPVHSPRTLENPSSDTLKGPSENPPQIPSKDPQKTLLRHPQRTLAKPSRQSPRGP